jgi:protein-tyrosine phosphatase
MEPPITHANVERIDDELLVTWRGAPDVDDVAVFVSLSPDDAGVDIRDPDRPGRAVLRGLDPDQRHYIHLLAGDGPFVITAERLVPLEGALNFRDLGGYRSADGRRVRWGCVFRSDHLGGLTDADLAKLERLGVQVIVDYRGPGEHEATPSRIAADGAMVRMDRAIGDGAVEGVSLYDRIVDGSLTDFGVADLTTFYLATFEASATIFGEVLGLAADHDRHAIVFHCTAGKDRTGLTAALLLAALGVDDPQILDDYELTNRYRSGRRVEVLRPELAEQGIDIDRFLPLFTAPRRALADALIGLRERHGSIERYLTDRAGLTPDAIAQLRAHLLTP